MHAHTEKPQDHRLMLGLVMGTVVGAALTLWFAPRAADELRQRLTRSAQRLTRRAAAGYHTVSDRLGERVDEFAGGDPGVADDALASGSHSVTHGAAIKTRQPAGRKHAATHHHAATAPLL